MPSQLPVVGSDQKRHGHPGSQLQVFIQSPTSFHFSGIIGQNAFPSRHWIKDFSKIPHNSMPKSPGRTRRSATKVLVLSTRCPQGGKEQRGPLDTSESHSIRPSSKNRHHRGNIRVQAPPHTLAGTGHLLRVRARGDREDQKGHSPFSKRRTSTASSIPHQGSPDGSGRASGLGGGAL